MVIVFINIVLAGVVSQHDTARVIKKEGVAEMPT